MTSLIRVSDADNIKYNSIHALLILDPFHFFNLFYSVPKLATS